MKAEFEPLELKHKPLYASFPIISPNSKYSFAQGFMWQEAYDTRICIRDNYMLFTAKPQEEAFFVSPVLRTPESIVPAINEMLEIGGDDFSMHYVCPEIINAINEHFPDMFTFELNRGDSEYVYTAESLMTLSGKKLHQKRNHVNAFCKNYQYEFFPYDQSHFDGCMRLQESWLDSSNNGDAAETYAIQKALLNYNELGLNAAVIMQNGEITAFSIGERIGSSAVILIEKASPDYNGLFQVINKDTVSHLFSDCEYINRCEDLDIEGLRKAKLSYKPCFLIDKYTCRLKKDQ